MITDEKVVNTIKLISLKNALDFDNKIKIDVVISRLFSYSKYFGEKINVKEIIPDIKQIVYDISLLSIEEKRVLFDEINTKENHFSEKIPAQSGENNISKGDNLKNYSKKVDLKSNVDELPALEGAIDGKVITRFPPEPNGYPHIGHAKAAIIDQEYARQYHGKLILRYDDTNPVKEKLEYYDAIKEGLDWLGVKPDIIKNTSDDLDLLYENGKKLINKGSAYVCLCSSELVKNNRSKGITCDCTTRSIIQNLNFYEEMIKGKFEQNQAILRYRGNMKDQNTVMRDPTLFRIIKGYHPKLGSDYFLWPTYDFATPIEDSIDGVTYAFRTKEYELRNELYYAILDDLNLHKPKLIEFSRLEFEGLPVSKRKITPLIENGIIKRWDDPRLPTLVGLRRRGILPEAIRKFVISLSITLAETKPSFEILESINRKLVDPTSLRLFFVKDPIPVFIDNLSLEEVEIKNHPTNIKLGKRKVRVDKIVYISNDDAVNLKTGDKIRLMDLCNIEILSIEKSNKDQIGDYPSNKNIIAKNIGDDLSHNIQKIQWVSKSDKIPLSVLKPLQLYVGDTYNEKSLLTDSGLTESFLSKISKNTIVQFVRYGFCRIDDESTAIFTHR